jgi:endonuclease/exonuclease/phosphatase family metal-dependent hydrolase
MKLSVLQWNVWYQEKADNILRFLQETDADILCLQELTQESFINPGCNLPKEIELLGYYSHYKVALNTVGKFNRQLGNGIFSKFPVVSSEVFYTQHASDNLIDPEDRLCLTATLNVNSVHLTVGTVHLSWTHAPEYRNLPSKKAETDRFCEFIKSYDQKFILTGDFNAPAGSYTIQVFDKLLKPAGPDYSQTTWTTKVRDLGFIKFTDRLWRLDYVYATPDVKIVSSRILDTEYSDHLPILVELEI